MLYTAGEAAKMLGISTSTVRFYDKEGLLPDLERSPGGIRMFKESDIEGVRLIQCLKKTGLCLKDIKTFINLPADGDKTIYTRLAILSSQKKVLEEKKRDLEEMMSILDYKLWYYENAREKGSTKASQNSSTIPPSVRKGYESLHFLTGVPSAGESQPLSASSHAK